VCVCVCVCVQLQRENCYNNDTCDKNCDYCTTDEADYTNSVRPDDTTVNFQVAVDVGAKQQEK
jgi:hypothetical protein